MVTRPNQETTFPVVTAVSFNFVARLTTNISRRVGNFYCSERNDLFSSQDNVNGSRFSIISTGIKLNVNNYRKRSASSDYLN